MSTDIQAIAIDRLKAHGWSFDRILTTAATKLYETAVGPKQASVRITVDRETSAHWLLGEYTSEGRNALASCFAFFPQASDASAIHAKVDAFNADVERAIAGTYAARLLQTGGAA